MLAVDMIGRGFERGALRRVRRKASVVLTTTMLESPVPRRHTATQAHRHTQLNVHTHSTYKCTPTPHARAFDMALLTHTQSQCLAALTIWSLTILPSKSTVRIFCERVCEWQDGYVREQASVHAAAQQLSFTAFPRLTQSSNHTPSVNSQNQLQWC